MADTKISALTELTDPIAGDFLAVVDTSAGASGSKKLDFGKFNLFTTPAGAAAANVTALQAFLNQGGYLRLGTSDSYAINAKLTIPSNTILDLGTATISVEYAGYGFENSDVASGNVNIAVLNGTVVSPDGLSGNGSTMLHFRKVDGLRVDSMNVGTCYQHGIQLEHCSNFQIINNRAIDTGDDPIAIEGIPVGGTGTGSNHGTVANNYCSTNHAGAGSSSGIEIEHGAEKLVITGNVIENMTASGQGILVTANQTDPQEECGNLIISDNIINTCASKGLWLDNNKTSGALFEGIVISDNIIIAATNDSIYVNKCSGVTVTGNIIRDHVGTTNPSCIRVIDSDRVNVANNVLKDATGIGINVGTGCDSVIVQGNNILNMDNDASGSQPAIQINTSSRCSVIGNTVDDDQGTVTTTGILVATSPGTVVVGNVMSDVIDTNPFVINPSTDKTTVVKGNVGFSLVEEGRITFVSGQTTAEIQYTLARKPDTGLAQVQLSPVDSNAKALDWWINENQYTSGFLRVNLAAAPSGDATFNYRIDTSGDVKQLRAELDSSSTAWPTCTAAEIVAGGETLVIDLLGGVEWVAAGATFDAERQGIIDGINSRQAEAAGWDARMPSTGAGDLAVTDVARTSNTRVTITFSASGSYAITGVERVAMIIPKTAITYGEAIIMNQMFIITP